MGPSNATILLLVALDGPIIALLIIHTQQEVTPQSTMRDSHGNHNSWLPRWPQFVTTYAASSN
jgi:hypothetical protein